MRYSLPFVVMLAVLFGIMWIDDRLTNGKGLYMTIRRSIHGSQLKRAYMQGCYLNSNNNTKYCYDAADAWCKAADCEDWK